MHGIWTLVFFPVAAVIGWRYSGPRLKKIALMLTVLVAIALAIWFGYLTFVGTEFAESMLDRVMHAMGKIVGSINVPVLQVLAALLLLISWPRKWVFAGFSDNEPVEPVAKIDSGTPVI